MAELGSISELIAQAKRLGIGDRSSKYGVGKTMGDNTWVHKDYEAVFPANVIKAAKQNLSEGFDYTAVRYNRRDGSVAFIQCGDFDTAHEPTVGASCKVSKAGEAKVSKAQRDPLIWHHKWTFVKDDYPGFDVAASVRRSIAWKKKLGKDAKMSSRIGRKSVWESEVVPRLATADKVVKVQVNLKQKLKAGLCYIFPGPSNSTAIHQGSIAAPDAHVVQQDQPKVGRPNSHGWKAWIVNVNQSGPRQAVIDLKVSSWPALASVGGVDQKIVDFLKKNPEPDDSLVHKLADTLGIEHDDLEERIYKLLSQALQKDNIPGGLADNKSAKGVDPEQLRMGIEVEMEHTDDPKQAREIALDHLLGEDPKYYTKLKAIESATMNLNQEIAAALKDSNPELAALVEAGALDDRVVVTAGNFAPDAVKKLIELAKNYGGKLTRNKPGVLMFDMVRKSAKEFVHKVREMDLAKNVQFMNVPGTTGVDVYVRADVDEAFAELIKATPDKNLRAALKEIAEDTANISKHAKSHYLAEPDEQTKVLKGFEASFRSLGSTAAIAAKKHGVAGSVVKADRVGQFRSKVDKAVNTLDDALTNFAGVRGAQGMTPDVQKKLFTTRKAFDDFRNAWQSAAKASVFNAKYGDAMSLKATPDKKAAGTVYDVSFVGKRLTFKSEQDLIKGLAKLGFKKIGVNKNPNLREELQGQPKFQGILGPMYGGPGQVRYESPEKYRALSAGVVTAAIKWSQEAKGIYVAQASIKGKEQWLRIDGRSGLWYVDRLATGDVWEKIDAGAVPKLHRAKQFVQHWIEIQAASEEPLSKCPKDAIQAFKGAKIKPTDYWEGIHGKILGGQAPAQFGDSFRFGADKLKKLLKVKGVRWIEGGGDGRVSIGF